MEKEESAKKIEKEKNDIEAKETAKTETTKEKANISKKPEIKKTEKPKKFEAKVRITSAPISTIHSIALCKFIKQKGIERAIEDLEKVATKKKALPMKGEYPHKKGMMSGKYPQNSTRYFIKLLKSLQSNAGINEIKNPVITEAIANLAPRPRGRFGKYQRKRTHITIIAKEKKLKENGKENEK